MATYSDLLEFLIRITPMVGVFIAFWGAFSEIRRYNNAQENAKIAEFRSSLVQLNAGLETLDSRLQYTGFSDMISYHISKQIKEDNQDVKSKQQFIDLLQQEAREISIRFAPSIVYSLEKSELRNKLLQMIDELKLIPLSHEASMPLTIEMINVCLYLIEDVTKQMLSSDTAASSFLNGRLLDELVGLETDDIDEVYRQISLVIFADIYLMLRDNVIPIVSSSRKLVEKIARKILEMQNNRISELQRKDKEKYYKLPFHEDPLETLIVDWDILNSITWFRARKNALGLQSLPVFGKGTYRWGFVEIRRILKHYAQLNSGKNDWQAYMYRLNEKYPDVLSNLSEFWMPSPEYERRYYMPEISSIDRPDTLSEVSGADTPDMPEGPL